VEKEAPFLPCPFCGYKDEHDNFQYVDGPPIATAYQNYAVQCCHCEALGPWGRSPEKAKENWNKRE